MELEHCVKEIEELYSTPSLPRTGLAVRAGVKSIPIFLWVTIHTQMYLPVSTHSSMRSSGIKEKTRQESFLRKSLNL